MSLLRTLVFALAALTTVEALPLSPKSVQYTLVNSRPDSTTPQAPTKPLLRRDDPTISDDQTNTTDETTPFIPKPLPNLHVLDYNTLNGTVSDDSTSLVTQAGQPNSGLTVSFVNNFDGHQLFAYIVGLGPAGQVVLLKQDGTWYSPTPVSTTIPEQINVNVSLPINGRNQTTSYQLPTTITSGRIFVSEGELQFGSLATPTGATLVEPDFNNPNDPSSILNWSYIELTTSDSGIAVNLSYVDFIGLPLGMSITSADGTTTTVPGINNTAVKDICRALSKIAKNETAPWDQLCLYNNIKVPLRVAAPSKFMAVNPGFFTDYYTSYVDAVYDRYTADNPLTITTSTNYGNVTCAASNNVLTCDGANRAFPKPTSSDIFSCNGVFQTQQTDNDVVLSIVPILCAAFSRTTLLIDGGDLQPNGGASTFYTTTPTNQYAKLVHRHEIDGLGYAFAYDDVHARDQPDASGLINTPNADTLTISIGGEH